MCEWGIENLTHRRRHQLLSLMNSHDPDTIARRRPEITFQNRDKIKFKAVFTRNTKLLNSLYYRGICEWDTLPFQVKILSAESKF